MVKIKVADATPLQLDYLVAVLHGRTILSDPMGLHPNSYWIWEEQGPKPCYWRIGGGFSPSTNWEQGMTIVYRERIALDVEHGDPWRARFGRARITFDGRAHHYHHAEGPTPLIAAMRCYVASKLGNEVEIPEELCD